MFKNIKDPVHGYIDLDEEDLEILNTPILERLRFIHHLGTGFLIYPGATHSRFEHSLGVMHLGTKIFDSLVKSHREFWEIKDDEIQLLRKTIRWACLLHDIGHLPFSHTLEEFCELEDVYKELKRLGIKEYNVETRDYEDMTVSKKHELLSFYLVIKEYADLLDSFKIDSKVVAALILGKIGETKVDHIKYLRVMKSILDSPIDVDKLDYLLRDNYMTGVNLVSLDVDRLISSYCIYGNDLYLNDKALSIIMNLIKSRELMYLWVYQHHKVVFTDHLLKTIIDRMCMIDSEFKNNYLSFESIKQLVDDGDILKKIKESDDGIVKHYYQMITDRNYLSSCWKHRFELKILCGEHMNNQLLGLLHSKKTITDLKEQICADLDINKTDIIIASKRFSTFTPEAAQNMSLILNDAPITLNELGYIQTNSETFGQTAYIYCPKEKKEPLREWMNEGLKTYIEALI